MPAPLFDQSLALSAMTQAAATVEAIARDGNYDETAMAALVDSLFVFDADTTEAIYGSRFNLSYGKRVLKSVFTESPGGRNQVVMAYMNGILALERKLAKQPEMLAVIQTRLQEITNGRDTLYTQREQLYAAIAGVYTDTISKLSYRIKVTGNADELQKPANADAIRTALFAGVRAAILWRQLGGRRWKLIFQRTKLVESL